MKSDRTHYLAWLLLSLTTLFWGGNFVLGRAVSADIPPIALAWWRWALALVLILPIALRPVRAAMPILKRHWRYMLLVSVLSVSLFNTLVYLGLQTQPASTGLLVLASAPALILGFSWLLFKDRMTARQAVGILFSVSGVLVIVSQGSPASLADIVNQGQGNLWILAAAISWSLYSVLLRRRPEGLGGLPFFAVTVVLGWICLTPFFLYEHLILEHRLVWTMQSMASVLYVAVLASVVAFLFWNRGVQLLGPAKAGYFINLIPVWGLLLASLLLGERLAYYHWFGVVMIFTGILLANIRRKKASFAETKTW